MKRSLKKIIANYSNTAFAKGIRRLIFSFERKLQHYYGHERFNQVLSELSLDRKEILFYASELQMLMSFAEALRAIDGAYAEVGVYQGTSAKAICEFKGDKELHLFDTFEGLPEGSQLDTVFKKEMFKANRLQTEERLSAYENVHVHQGLFPESADRVKHERFAFVHLDVDLYQSTKDALHFFFPRLNSGGIIISHDYHLEGVKAAINEFEFGENGLVIPMAFSQVMIWKR